MNNLLDKYAKLVICTGVNLQKGQKLVINAPIECNDFARRVAKAAYEAGGRDVSINWQDERFARLRYDMAANDVFDEFPQWLHDKFQAYMEDGVAVVSIHAADPSVFKGVDSDKLMRKQRADGLALLDYRSAIMNNKLRWCVVSIPTAAWAMKVFPGLKEEQAISRLWEAILSAVRIGDDNDPVRAWQQHVDFMKRAHQFLNGLKLRELHYTNSMGTDLKIRLPEGHIWAGGAELSADQVWFVANMPTEEVYTLPERNGVNGVVYSSKPLSYRGNIIEGMRLVFKDGKAVEATAVTGEEALKQLLTADEGSSYLGEVALVPFDSPISNSGILFFNTLFDENAACHLAFGRAYPTCIQGGEDMDSLELAQHGVNDSIIHEDFMIGTADLDITGITDDGRQVQIFKDGNFVEF